MSILTIENIEHKQHQLPLFKTEEHAKPLHFRVSLTGPQILGNSNVRFGSKHLNFKVDKQYLTRSIIDHKRNPNIKTLPLGVSDETLHVEVKNNQALEQSLSFLSEVNRLNISLGQKSLSNTLLSYFNNNTDKKIIRGFRTKLEINSGEIFYFLKYKFTKEPLGIFIIGTGSLSSILPPLIYINTKKIYNQYKFYFKEELERTWIHELQHFYDYVSDDLHLLSDEEIESKAQKSEEEFRYPLESGTLKILRL